VLQPDMRDRSVSASRSPRTRLGLREGPVARPKPAGTTRVVLLGDSYVMGEGVEADDRFGVSSPASCASTPGAAAGPVECLHFGLDNWNVVAGDGLPAPPALAGAARPRGARAHPQTTSRTTRARAASAGMSSFDPLHGERGEPLFQARFPMAAFQTRETNWIAHGLDFESRSRFEEAGRRVADLARRVEAAGGRYLLVDNYSGLLPASRRYIASKLSPAQVCYLPSAPQREERWRVAKDNAHWNRAGHELVASLLYSVIRARRLLPALPLAEWPQADALAKEWLDQGDAEADGEPRFDRRRSIASGLDFRNLDDDAARADHRRDRARRQWSAPTPRSC
jgi:hypothetical protein